MNATKKSVRVNLTADYINRLQPTGKPYRVYDDKVRSLAVSVSRKGEKSLGLYRSWKNKPFSKTISVWNDGVSIANARKIAGEWNTMMANGIDPRQPSREEREGITLKDAFDHYNQHAKDNGRRSWRYTEQKFNLYLETLHNRPLVSITTFDLSEIVTKLGRAGKKTTANRVRTLLATIYNHAIRYLEYPHRNVARSVIHYEEKSRERFLDDAEIERLLKECEAEGEPYSSLFTIAITTGMRISNCLQAEFAEVNFEGKIWTIPPEKSKTGDAIIIPLADTALEAFKKRRDLASKNQQYVFPRFGKREGTQPFMCYPKWAWLRIVKRANLEGLVIHALRHTFISRIAKKHGIYVAMRLAGHKRITTTQKYTHSAVEDLRAAVNSSINF